MKRKITVFISLLMCLSMSGSTTYLFKGEQTLDWSGGVKIDAYKFAKAEAGDKVTINVTETSLKVFVPSLWKKPVVEDYNGASQYNFTITDNILSALKSEGLQFQGGATLLSVTAKFSGASTPVTGKARACLFSTPTEVGNWSTNIDIASDVIVSAKVQEGDYLRINFEHTGTGAQIKVADVNWNAIYENYSVADDVDACELLLNNEMVENIKAGDLHIQGKNLCIENVALASESRNDIFLSEAFDNSVVINENKDTQVDVALQRTLKVDVWNTFSVPFNFNIEGSALNDATVMKVKSVDEHNATIYFETATTIEAGKAYMVKTNNTIENPSFTGVTVNNAPIANSTDNDHFQFVGTYNPKMVTETEAGTVYGISGVNTLAKIKANTSIKGMRAYFVVDTNMATAKLNFDGEVTAIDVINAAQPVMGGKVYNLNGQLVGECLSVMPKGIYIVGGKKVVK